MLTSFDRCNPCGVEQLKPELLDDIPTVGTLKVVVLGQWSVGRRSIVDMFTTGEIRTTYDPTLIEPEYYTSVGLGNNRVSMKWLVQECGGGDCIITYVPSLSQIGDGINKIRESDGIALMYDVGSRASFEFMKVLYNLCYLENRQKAPDTYPKKPCWILANKIDLDPSRWEVALPEGEEYSQSIGATFFPISCRTTEGLEGLQELISNRMLMMKQGIWAIVPAREPVVDVCFPQQMAYPDRTEPCPERPLFPEPVAPQQKQKNTSGLKRLFSRK